MNPSASFLNKLPQPQFGDRLKAAFPSQDVLKFLSQRRSLLAKDMAEPGPTSVQIEQLLEIASRVPDHGRLSPWRFVLFQKAERAHFGTLLAEIFTQDNPTATDAQISFEKNRFMRAPLVMAVVATPVSETKIPEWEQYLTSGAVCQNMLIAANAMGFAAQWLTEWYAYHPRVIQALCLESHEKISGFLYIGTANIDPCERKRPDVAQLTQNFSDILKPTKG